MATVVEHGDHHGPLVLGGLSFGGRDFLRRDMA